MLRKPLRLGIEFPCSAGASAALRRARETGYDFICLSLAYPEQRKLSTPSNCGEVDPENLMWLSREMELPFEDWRCVVPKMSNSSNLENQEDPAMRKNAENVLLQELQFMHYLGCKSLIVELHTRNNTNLMRHLYSRLTGETQASVGEEIWLQIPTASGQVMNRTRVQQDDTWNWWNNARLLCHSHHLLRVALELTCHLPNESQLDRWLGEPVELIIVPYTLFTAQNGSALPGPHAEFLRKMARRNTSVLITRGYPHRRDIEIENLNSLYATAVVPNHLEDVIHYDDQCMLPLQPLAYHLESYTYEIFEKDPVKYLEYGNAVCQALLDRVPDSNADTDTQVVMIVGAGRGPLVTEVLNAAERARRKVRVYALDKNPNAVIALSQRKRNEWGDRVTVVSCDMRTWKAPEKCDILVSELLGSFGDNELSPECLDGAQVYLKDDGISIPQSYRSFVCPTMSMSLHNSVGDWRKPSTFEGKVFEGMYVTGQNNAYTIAPHQQLFEFIHPNRGPILDNDRFKKLNWTASEACTLYGFTGYFDTTLYKDIKLSICPDTYSVGMISWYPIYIPIKRPISLKKWDPIELLFWRRHDSKNVWYEWAVTRPTSSGIHNVNGQSSTIGLS